MNTHNFMCFTTYPLGPLWPAGAGACANPKVTSETYSTGDELMSSEVVFIVQMEVECEGEVSRGWDVQLGWLQVTSTLASLPP